MPSPEVLLNKKMGSYLAEHPLARLGWNPKRHNYGFKNTNYAGMVTTPKDIKKGAKRGGIRQKMYRKLLKENPELFKSESMNEYTAVFDEREKIPDVSDESNVPTKRYTKHPKTGKWVDRTEFQRLDDPDYRPDFNLARSTTGHEHAHMGAGNDPGITEYIDSLVPNYSDFANSDEVEGKWERINNDFDVSYRPSYVSKKNEELIRVMELMAQPGDEAVEEEVLSFLKDKWKFDASTSYHADELHPEEWTKEDQKFKDRVDELVGKASIIFDMARQKIDDRTGGLPAVSGGDESMGYASGGLVEDDIEPDPLFSDPRVLYEDGQPKVNPNLQSTTRTKVQANINRATGNAPGLPEALSRFILEGANRFKNVPSAYQAGRGLIDAFKDKLTPQTQAMTPTGETMPVPTPSAGLGALQATGWNGREIPEPGNRPVPGYDHGPVAPRPSKFDGLKIKPGESGVHDIPLNQISRTAKMFPRDNSEQPTFLMQNVDLQTVRKKLTHLRGSENQDDLRVIMTQSGDIFIAHSDSIHEDISRIAAGRTLPSRAELGSGLPIPMQGEDEADVEGFLTWDKEKGIYTPEELYVRQIDGKESFHREAQILKSFNNHPTIRSVTGNEPAEQGLGSLEYKDRMKAEALLGRVEENYKPQNEDESFGYELQQFMKGDREYPEIRLHDPETNVRFDLRRKGNGKIEIDIGDFENLNSPWAPGKSGKMIYSQGVLRALMDMLKEKMPDTKELFGKRTTTGKNQSFRFANGGLVSAFRSRMSA